MPIGRPCASSRPPTSGAARSSSIQSLTPRRSSKRSCRMVVGSPLWSAGNSADLPDTLIESAPAKVNLFLHVTGWGPDGYHLLDSLVVFAAAEDVLRGEPANELTLDLEGPFA